MKIEKTVVFILPILSAADDESGTMWNLQAKHRSSLPTNDLHRLHPCLWCRKQPTMYSTVFCYP